MGNRFTPNNYKSDIFPFSKVGFIRPSWSPDNKKVAWLVWDKSDNGLIEGVVIYNIDKESMGFYYPYEVWHGEFPSYLDWNPKKDLLKVETEGSVSILDVDGTNIYNIDNAIFSGWSPDGNWLTYISTKNGNWAATIMSHNGKEVYELDREIVGIWSPDNKYLLYADGFGYSMEEIGKWIPMKIDLPEDTFFVDWVNSEK